LSAAALILTNALPVLSKGLGISLISIFPGSVRTRALIEVAGYWLLVAGGRYRVLATSNMNAKVHNQKLVTRNQHPVQI
jgi:hypothetical protein